MTHHMPRAFLYTQVHLIFYLFGLLRLVLLCRTASTGHKTPPASFSAHYFASLAQNKQNMSFTFVCSASNVLSHIGLAALCLSNRFSNGTTNRDTQDSLGSGPCATLRFALEDQTLMNLLDVPLVYLVSKTIPRIVFIL